MVNRIIGILVVVAVSVLASPYLFNHYDALSQETIKAPPFPSQQAQNDTIRALADHTKSNKVAVFTESNKHLKANLKTMAWVIQVGSYQDKLKALSMVNQLRSKGYNAFIHQRGSAFGDDTQVFIGPEIKRDLAESVASKLSKETKISGIVKSYKPLTA